MSCACAPALKPVPRKNATNAVVAFRAMLASLAHGCIVARQHSERMPLAATTPSKTLSSPDVRSTGRKIASLLEGQRMPRSGTPQCELSAQVGDRGRFRRYPKADHVRTGRQVAVVHKLRSRFFATFKLQTGHLQ